MKQTIVYISLISGLISSPSFSAASPSSKTQLNGSIGVSLGTELPLTSKGLMSTRQPKYITFEKAVYDDKACQTLAGPTIVIDAGKYCNPYAYYDSQGVLFQGAVANVRCYKDKIIADNYPFSPTCDPKAKIIDKNQELLVGACKAAISHEGTVYEKLIGYKYPGNIKCIDNTK